MMDKIKNPEHQVWHGSAGKQAYIYESPDGGKTVYARPMGGDPRNRQLVKGDLK